MKRLALPRIKLTSPYFFSLFFLLSLVFSLAINLQIGQAQQLQLSLADILTGLRSKKVTLIERNKLLTDAVRRRGVTFTLSPEIEKELEITGADKVLIEAIRQKSPIIKATPTPVTAALKPSPSPVPSPTPDFAFFQNRANARFIKGEYDLAVADYNKVIELNPKDASTYFNRGTAYYNKKSYSLAIADYDKALELNPKEIMAYLNRADSFEKTGDTQKAIGDYLKAVELDANNEVAKNNLKRLQIEQAKNQPEAKKPEIKTPVSTIEQAAIPEIIELGELNKIALNLVMPKYPEIARKSGIQGKVIVQVTIDQEGKVSSAKAISGPVMLRNVSEDAVSRSKFKPTIVGDKAVKASGFIAYNFVN